MAMTDWDDKQKKKKNNNNMGGEQLPPAHPWRRHWSELNDTLKIVKQSAPGKDDITPGGGGVPRGVRHTGMCRYNRSLFWEKPLNIGYGFELEILKHTPHFCNFAVDTRYFRPFRR